MFKTQEGKGKRDQGRGIPFSLLSLPSSLPCVFFIFVVLKSI
jgi:hypothetical protein